MGSCELPQAAGYAHHLSCSGMRVVHTLYIVLFGEMLFPNTCSPVQTGDHGEGHSGDVIHIYKPTIKQVDEFGIKPFKLKQQAS